MKDSFDFTGKSQYDDDIDKRFRPSACGPVTAYLMLNHHFPSATSYSVNELYRLLGGTRIGLFTWRFMTNMKKLLGNDWNVTRCSIDEVIQQIDAGHPVAAKFDKWFTLRWGGKYEFDYHWVPIIGYDKSADDVTLIIHDNGGINRSSKLRRVSYNKNKPILTFIKMEQLTKYKKGIPPVGRFKLF